MEYSKTEPPTYTFFSSLILVLHTRLVHMFSLQGNVQLGHKSKLYTMTRRIQLAIH